MKLNAEKRQKERGEFRDLEVLAQKGRQLHSKAIFDSFAALFNRRKSSHTNLLIQQQKQNIVNSHKENAQLS